MNLKRKNQRAHAIKRLHERYGIKHNTVKEYKIFATQLMDSPKTVLIKNYTLRVTLQCHDGKIYFLYDRRRKEIVTYLTEIQVEESYCENIKKLYKWKTDPRTGEK